MTKEELTLFESPAVIKHVEILQDIITRMARNSASCKTWALTVVTGIIALFFNNGFPVLIGIFPIVFFYLLDSFYLGLEKQFRELYNDFLKKLQEDKLEMEDVYSIKPKATKRDHMEFICYGAKSFSTLFFYPPILAIIIILFCCNN